MIMALQNITTFYPLNGSEPFTLLPLDHYVLRNHYVLRHFAAQRRQQYSSTFTHNDGGQGMRIVWQSLSTR